MRLRLAFFLATLLPMAAVAGPRHAKQTVVLTGRLYPSGDFTAIVSAEVRRSDLHVADRGDQATALALAELQMGSSHVRVEPVGGDGSAPPTPGGIARLHYKLAVRPWILPRWNGRRDGADPSPPAAAPQGAEG